MDDRRFDALARTFAGVRSRRRAVKLLGGGLAAGLLTAAGRGDAEAGRVGAFKERCKEKGGDYCPRLICTNLDTDEEHCGSCSRRCSSGAVCRGGRCECLSGAPSCDGACCTSEQTCVAGTDASGDAVRKCCATGAEVCDGRCVNPATYYQDDPENCGECGVLCPTFFVNRQTIRGACCNGICSATGSTCP